MKSDNGEISSIGNINFSILFIFSIFLLVFLFFLFFFIIIIIVMISSSIIFSVFSTSFILLLLLLLLFLFFIIGEYVRILFSFFNFDFLLFFEIFLFFLDRLNSFSQLFDGVRKWNGHHGEKLNDLIIVLQFGFRFLLWLLSWLLLLFLVAFFVIFLLPHDHKFRLLVLFTLNDGQFFLLELLLVDGDWFVFGLFFLVLFTLVLISSESLAVVSEKFKGFEFFSEGDSKHSLFSFFLLDFFLLLFPGLLLFFVSLLLFFSFFLFSQFFSQVLLLIVYKLNVVLQAQIVLVFFDLLVVTFFYFFFLFLQFSYHNLELFLFSIDNRLQAIFVFIKVFLLFIKIAL